MRLRRVCKLWKDIADSIPTIWTTIVILLHHLQLSSHQLLNITIRASVEHDITSSLVFPILTKIIGCSRQCARLYWMSHPAIPFPLLKEVGFTSNRSLNINLDAPLLEVIRVDMYTAQRPMSFKFTWRFLTTLDISGSLETIHPLLPYCYTVEVLTITAWGNPSMPQITVGSPFPVVLDIRQLMMTVSGNPSMLCQFLDRLVLPNLDCMGLQLMDQDDFVGVAPNCYWTRSKIWAISLLGLASTGKIFLARSSLSW